MMIAERVRPRWVVTQNNIPDFFPVPVGPASPEGCANIPERETAALDCPHPDFAPPDPAGRTCPGELLRGDRPTKAPRVADEASALVLRSTIA